MPSSCSPTREKENRSMPLFCPECRTEYRDGFDTCYDCEVPLVHAEELDRAAARVGGSATRSTEGLQVLRLGPFWELSEIVKHMRDKGVPCALAEVDRPEGGSSCGKVRGTFGILVKTDDMEWARETHEAYIQGIFERDGADRVESVVDLDAGPSACPACGETVLQGKAECPSCGLYLGVPETPEEKGGCC